MLELPSVNAVYSAVTGWFHSEKCDSVGYCFTTDLGRTSTVTRAPSKFIINNNISAMNNIHRFNESCLLIAMYMNNNIQVTQACDEEVMEM